MDDFHVDLETQKRFFFLRLKPDSTISVLALEGVESPLQARCQSRAMGYEPTHWMVSGKLILQRFY